MTAQPQTEAQERYLLALTEPHHFARLSAAEARYLIGWLRGPPPNMSRAQQLFLAGLLSSLSRDQVRDAIEHLRAMAEPAPAPAVADSMDHI